MKQKSTSLRFPEIVLKQIIKDYGSFSKGIYALTYPQYKQHWDQYFQEKILGAKKVAKKNLQK